MPFCRISCAILHKNSPFIVSYVTKAKFEMQYDPKQQSLLAPLNMTSDLPFYIFYFIFSIVFWSRGGDIAF